MRITNTQKTGLINILKKYNLDSELFEFNGQDELYTIKFIDNYFEFTVKKITTVGYECYIKSVNNKNPAGYKASWEHVLVYFDRWVQGIADDVKDSPNKNKIKNAEKAFPKEVEKYSKNFIIIYNQAYKAEINGLAEICGLGYRKAFEFLIKDYLIKKNPKEEHQKIKTLMVAKCIDQYVTDDQIKLLSHRVLWLGNDHAHYIRKWKGKTLDDLKKLIDLTIQWIKIKDELDRVHKSMPEGKK